MAVTTQQGDTPFLIAQRTLGNGNLHAQLNIPGVSDPHEPLPAGMTVYLPEERVAPPAIYEAANQRWGYGR